MRVIRVPSQQPQDQARLPAQTILSTLGVRPPEPAAVVMPRTAPAMMELPAVDPAYCAERLRALLHEPGTPASHVSPQRLAALLGLDLSELAKQAGVDRNTIEHAPGALSVQRYVRQVYRVLAAAVGVHGTIGLAVAWYRGKYLSEFNCKTMVLAGCPQAVLIDLQARMAAGEG